MILVLAGTKEGRLIAAALARLGRPVLASCATAYGAALLKEQLKAEGLKAEVRFGPLDLEAMAALLQRQKVALALDATHPFAIEARRNLQQACARLQLPWLRFERPALPAAAGRGEVIAVPDLDGAIAAAAPFTGNIFLTTGSNSVAAFARALGPTRLVVRLLPDPERVRRCLELGIAPERIVAMQGPFSAALNREMFRHFQAALVISKESGETGGLPAKLAAAAQLGLPVVVIGRPPLPEGPVLVFSDIQALLSYVEGCLEKR